MKPIFAFSLFLLLFGKNHAQTLTGTTHLPVSNWTWFFSVQQQSDGSIYVGDDDGTLIKYADAVWSTSKIADAAGNRITAVRTLANGKIWAGTDDKGLFFFDGSTWINFSTANSTLPSDWVRDIEVAADGTVWVGTTAGLVKIGANNAFTVFKESNGLKGGAAYDLQFQGSTLWIGGSGFLLKMVGSNFTGFDITPHLNGFAQSAYQISVSPTGKIWIGASFDGVACFNSSNNTFITLPAAVKNEYAQAILVDKDEVVWIGVTNFGLKTWNGASLAEFQSGSTKVPSGQLSRMIQSTDGHIWIVGLGGGILELTNWNVVDTNSPLENGAKLGLKTNFFSTENRLLTSWESPFAPDFLEIFDQNGRLVFSKKIENPLAGQLEIADFSPAPGILIVRASGKGQAGLVRIAVL